MERTLAESRSVRILVNNSLVLVKAVIVAMHDCVCT